MWTDFLELLTRDAAAVEFEAPVLAARAQGESAEVIEQLEKGQRLALRLREDLLTQRRRKDELTALYETADDLARLSDVDAVLEAIVRRARRLLRTDTAYLTMHDEDRGDTYMRVTDGSVSAEFQRVRLEMGKGLGGRVAQNATPYATSKYLSDARFDHTDDIDSAVIDEGLIAILGVPLRLGSRVIGVLFAADRSERPFSREEVALLDSLAAHAAAAIDKARLLDETRTALRELRHVNTLLNQRSEEAERAAAAHDRMTQLVLRGGGVEDLALALVEVLPGALIVTDEDHRKLAHVGDYRAPHKEALLRAVAASQSSGRAESLTEGDTTWWVAAVIAGQQQFGVLVLQRETPFEGADRHIFERVALVTALLLLSLRSGIEAENRVRDELLNDLLRHNGSGLEGISERARLLGFDLEEPNAVFVVSLEGVDWDRAVKAADHLVATTGGLSGTVHGQLVLVLHKSDVGAYARTLSDDLGRALSHPVTVGGAGPASGVEDIVAVYAAARRCLAALQSLGRTGSGASLDELGFVGLVLGVEPDVAGFVATRLGPLLEYDARRNTDLLGTLRAFFAAGCNLARTSEVLHVHVNTVTQRLERIGKLIGSDWQTPERQLEVRVALRLHRVSTTSA